MEEERFVRQADGRLVSGPSLSQPEPPKKSLVVTTLILGWIATLVLAFTIGLDFPTKSLHEQVIDKLQSGCVFTFRAISTNDAGRSDLEKDAESAVSLLKEQDATENVRSSSVEAQDGVKRMDSTATRLVVVSWEVCR